MWVHMLEMQYFYYLLSLFVGARPADLLKVLLSRSWPVNVAERAVVCAVGTVGTVPGVVAVNPR